MRFILSVSAAFVLGLGVLAGCQNNAATVKTETAKTNANSATTATTATTPKTDEHGHDDTAPRITLADAKKDFDAGNAVFLDTRAEATYRQEHIKGALNMPVEAVEAKYKEIPAGKKIIAYCSWPNEHSSAGLVAKLKEKGITNGYALVGGTKAWKDAGFPMGKSEEKPK